MSTSEIVPQALEGERIDRVVAVIGGFTRSDAALAVDNGKVTIGGQVVTSRSRRVHIGDEIMVDATPTVVVVTLDPDPSIRFDVVFEDDDVLVVNKPPGLVVHPGTGTIKGTLVHGLLARYPDLAALAVGDQDIRPGIVHRLDKGTSGLLMVGRTSEAVASLVKQLAARSVERRYVALAWGRFSARAGLIDAPVGRSDSDPTRMAVSASGREARTRYEVTQQFEHPEATALVACRLETGRTHQIRVHLAAIGHPVVGDTAYGGAKRTIPSPRVFLHAATLGFTHPVTGERLSFTSELPKDLAAVVATLS